MKKPGFARRETAGDKRPSWPLLFLAAALVCGVIAVGMAVYGGGHAQRSAARPEPVPTAPASPKPSKHARKPAKKKHEPARAKVAMVDVKVAAGTPYASRLRANQRQRRLVAKSLNTLAAMRANGTSSSELTKLESRLRARDKTLATQQKRLVAEARSWKAARAAAKKHPVVLAANDRPAGEPKTTIDDPNPELSDLADALSTDTPDTPDALDLTSDDALPYDDASASGRPDICALEDGRTSVTGMTPQYCTTCPRRIPFGDDGASGDTPQVCERPGDDTTTDTPDAARDAGVCLITRSGTASGATPQRCVPCPAGTAAADGTPMTSGSRALEALRRVCDALDPAHDTARRTSAAGKTFLCPGADGTYRACAPCPVSDRQRGGTIVPLCLLDDGATSSPARDTSTDTGDEDTSTPYSYAPPQNDDDPATATTPSAWPNLS
ncbi:hypothetical protein GCM10023191_039440 [Actinoallomurus oryzae]|uniref:Uncharacterized protein n=1 Tax=Actinoallomurus oryzae TaxID=502180 RepID=A0ABP8Q3S5_9ACTN